MSDYFFLAEKLKRDTAFAYTEGETPRSHELLPKLLKVSELPFDLVLKKVTMGSSGIQVSNDLTGVKHFWLDYQPNNLAWPLMSIRMKELVSHHLNGNEGVEWIKVNVLLGSERRDYFIPRFQRKLDVLDEQKTIFVKGSRHIIKPVYSLEKVIDYNFFHKPQEQFWEITSSLIVSEELKLAMQKEKLIGVDFEKVVVS
jgi:hypothetical protein